MPSPLGRQKTVEMTHRGHSCLQIDVTGPGGPGRLVVDPGVFSHDVPERADAVLLTHAHPDHVDPAAVAALATSGARIVAESGAAQALRDSGVLTHDADIGVLAPGETILVGGVEVEGVGGEHAVIHADVPRVGNVGLLLRHGGTTVFHPGDAYAYAPPGVDVLAVPLSAPWAAVKETVDFVRAVSPAVVVPVHDALLVPAAREMYLGHVRRLGGAAVHDLAAEGPLSR